MTAPRALPLLRLDTSASFEAARRLAGSSARQQRLHGHSFQVQVRSSGVGEDLPRLQRAVHDLAQTLDHQLLNDLLPDAADEALAGWFAHGLRGLDVEQVVLHAGASQGALWSDGQSSHWRRYAFEAAHRLPNVPLGHKCGRMHGHGFGVLVHAASREGVEAIDDAWAPLHHRLNYRCLNDIDGLHNPTSELLAQWLWQQLQGELQGLQRVTVFETGSSGAAFDGSRFSIWKQFTLDSAVRDEHGLHGHTYALRLHLAAALDELMGWVVDFGDVKALFAPVFEQLDHRPLYELAGLLNVDCASLAHWVFEQTRQRLPQLDRIDLHQTPGHGAIVAANERALHAGP